MVVQGKDLEKLDALMQANKEFKAKRAVQISVREQVRAIRQKFEAANGVNDFNGALQEPGFTVCDGKMQVFKNAIIHTQVTNDREQVRKNIEAAFERLAKWEALDGIDVEEYLK